MCVHWHNQCWLCADFGPSRKMLNNIQNSNHQYQMSFELKILCVSFLNTAMALSAEHVPPPQLITAYIFMMNLRWAQSFSKSAQLLYYLPCLHMLNLGTLCASLTMLQGIVAMLCAGLTTGTLVIKLILSKGKQCACISNHINDSVTSTSCSNNF